MLNPPECRRAVIEEALQLFFIGKVIHSKRETLEISELRFQFKKLEREHQGKPEREGKWQRRLCSRRRTAERQQGQSPGRRAGSGCG